MIDQETIQKIVETARIEEVVGDFVSLKKRGANHIGCCPFHNEKTPSFYVSPSKGIYKCFGCGEAGDVVKFVMKHEHYTYPEALRWIANKYNIEIKEEELSGEELQRRTERDGLFHASEFAQKYFADLLWNDEMGRAVGLSYFRSRGLSDDVIRRFGLGYCLDEWSNFTTHAQKNGYSLSVLEKTGLTIVNAETGKTYDRFRGRVMFPIYSISGRVLGFSGRVLSSEKQAAKYVNSPDSDIYNKSRILYGLYQARTAIAKAGKCYLVEGNVDVISMHQSGVENTVASCGTSLTVEQIRLIKRYTPNVTVLYDGDAAGIKAALRAIDLLFAEGMKVRLVLFPDGEDPDSYARKYGSTALQTYLSEHEDNFIMFKTRVTMDANSNDPIKRAELITDTARTIAMVSDLVERAEYIRQCSHLLHVDEDVLTAAVGKAFQQQRQKAAQSQQGGAERIGQPVGIPAEEEAAAEAAVQTATQPVQSATTATVHPMPESERHIVKLLLNYGNETVGIESEDGTVQPCTVAELIVSELQADELTLSDALCQRVYEQCALMVDMTHSIDAHRILQSADEQLRAFAATLMIDNYTLCEESWLKKSIYPPKMTDNLMQDVQDSINTLKMQYISRQIASLREQLRDAPAERQDELLMEMQQYIKASQSLGKLLRIVITPRQGI